jgi:hypothetical protein
MGKSTISMAIEKRHINCLEPKDERLAESVLAPPGLERTLECGRPACLLFGFQYI